MSHQHPPVFHPDHPHNQLYRQYSPSSPLGQISTNVSHRRVARTPRQAGRLSDSEMSSPSPMAKGRCFCGGAATGSEGGIYCSVACAREDAFSSLCYKPGTLTQSPLPAPHTFARQPPSLASSISASLSRNPSSSSTAATASISSNPEEWSASHYRRLAQMDVRREERREERRRRRAESSVASSTLSRTTTVSSISSSRVPDLVGGCHSRNPSVMSTSTVSSGWGGSLSRNVSSASSASTSSRRGHVTGVTVDAAIMEDDDEAEWLTSDKPYAPPARGKHGRRASRSGMTKAKEKKLESFGLGKDMRDVLEEIIQMEKGFIVDDGEGMEPCPPGLFTASFDRPPRTPSPAVDKKRRLSLIPAAPGAPGRQHRLQLSQNASSAKPRQRPPSLVGLHQSSLSESHTALYLATASPMLTGRRSASPTLEARNSLAFSADTAGPAIAPTFNLLPRLQTRIDSPSMKSTPSRRGAKMSPAHHPTMNGWRFPSPASASNTVTPTRPAPHSLPSQGSDDSFATPVHSSTLPAPAHARIAPHLLWPPPERPLGPSLFPCSPADDTPQQLTSLASRLPTEPSLPGPGQVVPPNSGMPLGVLLGSGDEMDIDDDDSTAHGHETAYLPLYLEAEGLRRQAFGRW